ncbi:ABC transporter substrate-binding protein [Aquibacillus koreensis]|uniref:ABC transporter substrate-binding protein n=1 Tax=Aquibacillus koreensis TaxID=279446 RepID=A0A9X3WMB5_9BACI|nr:extracellular solute-binding protein [Aquibacillus koreensis]MCT2537031.1 ABC transporter substrate-binding protein [Aquibacillus koreensis]MDC3422315.1 ABC transporter substrate-binding protein [Aquibacillus koreensis]
MFKFKHLLFALMLVLLLAVVGCSDDSDETSGENNEPDTSEEGTDNETPEEEPEENLEPVSYDFFDASGPGTDINTSEVELGKRFEEATGVTFDIEHIVGDVNQKIGTMIASGEYPELLNAEQSTDAVIDAGGFVPLQDLIKEHAPNLYDMYAPYWELMKRDDGNIYLISSGAPNGYARPANLEQGAWFIKREALAELDYPEPRTLDEYFAVIEEFMAANPQTEDGADRIGFTALTYDWRLFAFTNQPNHLAGFPNDGGAMIDMETQDATVYANTDYTRDWLKKLNEVNNKGLFDREAFTQNYDEYLAKITNGRVVGFFDYQWQIGDAWNKLGEDEDPYNDYMGFPITFSEDIKDQYLDPVAYVSSPGMGITTGTPEEDQIRIIKYLDHIAKIETQKEIMWGDEGVHYEVSDDGRYYRTEEQIAMLEPKEFRDAHGFTYFEWGWPRMSGLYDDGNSVEPRRQPEVAALSYKDGDKEFLDAYGITTFTELFAEPEERPWFPAWDTPVETGSDAALYDQTNNDLMLRQFPKIITGDPSEFDANWQEYLDEFPSDLAEAYEEVIGNGAKSKAEKLAEGVENANAE